MPSHQERRQPLPKGYQFGDMELPEAVGRYLLTKYTGDKDFDQKVRAQVLKANGLEARI